MAFNFGGVRQTEKPKQNLEKHDCLLREKYQPGEKYYLFLVDDILSKIYLDTLEKDIIKAGIKSYNIVSAISVKNPKEDSTTFLLSIESPWRQYLSFDETECECIIAFGSTIRILNKSGDVNYYEFIDDKLNSPRYFCGSEFIGGPDKWIYPVANIKDLYPIQLGNDPTNFFTKTFRSRLKLIQNDDMTTKSLDDRDYSIVLANSKEEASDILKSLVNSELLAVDTETGGFHFIRDKLGYIQFSNDGYTGFVLPWELVDKRILKQVLTSARRITLSNAKFDMKFIWWNGVKGWFPTDDTALLSHAINSGRPKGLKTGAVFYCGKFIGYDDELDKIKKKLKVNNYLEIPRGVLCKYAGLDPIVTWRLQLALDEHCKWLDKKFPNEKQPEWTINRFYKEIMIPNANTVTEVEYEGIYFSPAKFDASEKIIRDKIIELRKELAKVWNVDENYKFESPKELGALFEKMKWPKVSESKAGGYGTGDPVLNEYELLNLPGIKTLKDFRSYNVALGTFIEGWRKWMVQHEDGTWRIHPNCNTFGTESFRHAMNDPNFQQIPSGSTIAKHIKKLFEAPPNLTQLEDDLIGEPESHNSDEWLVISADFASLQFRLALADNGISKGGVDQIAYEIYGEKGHKDAHSATTVGTFVKPIHTKVIEIECEETGKKIIFGETQKIKVKRYGMIDEEDEIIIKGAEFQQTDEWIDYA